MISKDYLNAKSFKEQFNLKDELLEEEQVSILVSNHLTPYLVQLGFADRVIICDKEFNPSKETPEEVLSEFPTKLLNQDPFFVTIGNNSTLTFYSTTLDHDSNYICFSLEPTENKIDMTDTSKPFGYSYINYLTGERAEVMSAYILSDFKGLNNEVTGAFGFNAVLEKFNNVMNNEYSEMVILKNRNAFLQLENQNGDNELFKNTLLNFKEDTEMNLSFAISDHDDLTKDLIDSYCQEIIEFNDNDYQLLYPFFAKNLNPNMFENVNLIYEVKSSINEQIKKINEKGNEFPFMKVLKTTEMSKIISQKLINGVSESKIIESFTKSGVIIDERESKGIVILIDNELYKIEKEKQRLENMNPLQKLKLTLRKVANLVEGEKIIYEQTNFGGKFHYKDDNEVVHQTSISYRLDPLIGYYDDDGYTINQDPKNSNNYMVLVDKSLSTNVKVLYEIVDEITTSTYVDHDKEITNIFETNYGKEMPDISLINEPIDFSKYEKDIFKVKEESKSEKKVQGRSK